MANNLLLRAIFVLIVQPVCHGASSDKYYEYANTDVADLEARLDNFIADAQLKHDMNNLLRRDSYEVSVASEDETPKRGMRISPYALLAERLSKPPKQAQPNMFRYTRRRFDHPYGGLKNRLDEASLSGQGGSVIKRDFESVNLDCSGVYDVSIVMQLEKVCNNCYELFKEVEIHGFCRSNCFSTEIFRKCLQSLLLDSKTDFYMDLIKEIG